MSNSLYQSSISVFIRYLDNLSALLNIGLSHANDQNQEIDEATLISFQLFPDMHPFAKQVQVACDMVKLCGGRFAQVTPATDEDIEATFAELQSRIERTKAFLQSLPEDTINSAENRRFVIPAGPYELTFTGTEYLNLWVLPNMFFHITTAYNIMRHNAVPVGKIDYLGVNAFVTKAPE